MIKIRQEIPEDIPAIRTVNELAFAQPQEARLIDQLRAQKITLLSLVAVKETHVVGHLLFSPIEVEGNPTDGMGLAPLAVLPAYQRQGIGSQLIHTGIQLLTEQGCPFIIVLGHPEYYPRFGFEPASRYGIRSQWEVPEEAFMILILDSSKMGNISGVAQYRSEFNEAM